MLANLIYLIEGIPTIVLIIVGILFLGLVFSILKKLVKFAILIAVLIILILVIMRLIPA